MSKNVSSEAEQISLETSLARAQAGDDSEAGDQTVPQNGSKVGYTQQFSRNPSVFEARLPRDSSIIPNLDTSYSALGLKFNEPTPLIPSFPPNIEPHNTLFDARPSLRFPRNSLDITKARAYMPRTLQFLTPKQVQRLADLHWRARLTVFDEEEGLVEGVENPFEEGSRRMGSLRYIPEEVPASPKSNVMSK